MGLCFRPKKQKNKLVMKIILLRFRGIQNVTIYLQIGVTKKYDFDKPRNDSL